MMIHVLCHNKAVFFLSKTCATSEYFLLLYICILGNLYLLSCARRKLRRKLERENWDVLPGNFLACRMREECIKLTKINSYFRVKEISIFAYTL